MNARSHSIRFARSVGSVVRVPVFVFVLLVITRASSEWLPIPEKRVEIFEKWMGVLLILTLAWTASRVVAALLRSPQLEGKLSSSLQELFVKIARFVIYSLGMLVALGHLGVSITPLLASLGVGSIAIALALQDTLGNLFSGVYLLVDQPFLVGDQIRLEGGLEGRVKQIGWRSTHIELGTASLLVVPNSKLSSSMVTNFSRPIREVGMSVVFQVTYDADLSRIEALTQEIANSVMGSGEIAPADHVPVVRVTAFGDLGVQVTVFTKARSFDLQGLIRHRMLMEIKRRFDQEKITFAAVPNSVGVSTPKIS